MANKKKSELNEADLQVYKKSKTNEMWDRLPGEPEKWFKYFTIYLHLKKRSLRAAWNQPREKQGKEPSDTCSAAMREASQEWKWVQRAEAYDNAQTEKIRDLLNRYSEKFPKEAYDSAEKLLKKADEILALPIQQVEEVDEVEPVKFICSKCQHHNSIKQPIHKTIIRPINVKINDAKNLIDIGIKVKEKAFENAVKPLLKSNETKKIEVGRVKPEIVMPSLQIKRHEMLPDFVNEKKIRVNFDKYPYAKRWYMEPSPTFGLITGTQVGKSLFMRFEALTLAAMGLDVLYFVPTQGDARTLVNTGFNVAIEMSYQNMVGEPNNLQIKRFGRGNLYFRYSTSMNQFIAIPGDAYILDEADLSCPTYLHYLEDRISGSPYQLRRYVSTPTTADGYIATKFDKSTQELWMQKCTHCNHWQNIDYFDNVIRTEYDSKGFPVNFEPRDRNWNGRGDMNALCSKCGKPIDRHSIGEWVAKNPYAAYPMCRLSSVHSPYGRLADLWETWQESVHDPLRLTQFYNNRLAMPFTAPGAKVTDEMLNRCRQVLSQDEGAPPPLYISPVFNMQEWQANERSKEEEYRVPDLDNYIVTCGVDVGSDLDVRVSLTNQVSGVRQMLFVGKIENFNDLKSILVKYDVDICVIDMRPETRKVREFQKECMDSNMKAKVYMWSHVESIDKKCHLVDEEGIVKANIHQLYDLSYGDISSRRNILPANAETLIGGSYYEEMTASLREEVRTADRKVKVRWIETKPDHQRSADAYDICALLAWQQVPRAYWSFS